MKPKISLRALLTLTALLAAANLAPAQTTAFTYQGNLKQSGAAANGTYDFQFGLFTGSFGGTATATITNAAVAVANGLFTTSLDFGTIFDGTPFWLDIAIRTNGNLGPFTTLNSRQLLTPSPYALFAPYAGNVTGVLGEANLPASVALLDTSPVFQGTVTAASFSGDGSALTNVPTAPSRGYLYAYDLNTQPFPSGNVYLPISFSVPTAQLNGWALSTIGPGSTSFTSSNTGLYLVQYQAEITGTNGRTANIKATLNNNVEIAGSQSAVTLGTNTVTTLGKSFLAQINSNDVFKLQFTADNTGVNLTPSGSAVTRPSVTLTIVKIN